MACVTSARYTIMFQGHSDNVITPMCGLRQDYALLPYIFILCMNILTTMLNHEVHAGRIQGLCLTPTAGPPTNLMYADDLLFLGSINIREVNRINRTLQRFCFIPG